MGRRARPGARVFAALGGLLVRLLVRSWRVGLEGAEARDAALAEGAVAVFWHGQALIAAGLHRGRGVVALASRSRDGTVAAELLLDLGMEVVRGSSHAGAVPAARALLRALGQGRTVALAADGSRGPRHVVVPGPLALAARAGRPVLFAVARARPCVRLPTWDRFELPLPFARVTVRYGRLDVGGRGGEALERARVRLAVAMAAELPPVA